MKALTLASLLALAITFPGGASAQSEAATKAGTGMHCPMMGDMSAMQKDMGAMMSDMDGMMKGMSDPSLKARMQKMHDQMAAMMTNMKNMNGGMGMMGGNMMGGKMKQGGETPSPAPSAAPPASSKDHQAHHPKE